MDPTAVHPSAEVEVHPTYGFHWFTRAHELLASAELVADTHDEVTKHRIGRRTVKVPPDDPTPPNPLSGGHVQYLLLGLALELMFKAVWIHPKETPASQVTKVPKFWRGSSGHNLVRLADEINFPLSTQMRSDLADLTHAIVVFGRYPTTFKSKNGMPEKSSWRFPWGQFVGIFHTLHDQFIAQTPKNVRYYSEITGTITGPLSGPAGAR